jgi:hypothetical protein
MNGIRRTRPGRAAHAPAEPEDDQPFILLHDPDGAREDQERQDE